MTDSTRRIIRNKLLQLLENRSKITQDIATGIKAFKNVTHQLYFITTIPIIIKFTIAACICNALMILHKQGMNNSNNLSGQGRRNLIINWTVVYRC